MRRTSFDERPQAISQDLWHDRRVRPVDEHRRRVALGNRRSSVFRHDVLVRMPLLGMDVHRILVSVTGLMLQDEAPVRIPRNRVQEVRPARCTADVRHELMQLELVPLDPARRVHGDIMGVPQEITTYADNILPPLLRDVPVVEVVVVRAS